MSIKLYRKKSDTEVEMVLFEPDTFQTAIDQGGWHLKKIDCFNLCPVIQEKKTRKKKVKTNGGKRS